MKKLLSFLISSIILLNLTVAAKNIDIQGSYLEKPAAMLNAFGIIDENFDENAYITRSDAAKLIVRLMNETDQLEIASEMEYFHDVNPSTDCYKEIRFLASRGIFYGSSSGFFMPDKYITGDEAATVLLRVLGYGVLENESHSFKSKKQEVMNNTAASAKDLVMGDFIIMMYNSLFMEILDVWSQSSTTLLEQLDIYMAKGMLTNAWQYGIYENINLPINKCIIGGDEYIFNDGINYLGYTMKVYYRLDDEERTILYVDSSDNDILNIKAIDIVSADKSHIRYEDYSGREKVYNYGNRFILNYNGVLKTQYTDLDFNIESGNVQIIKNAINNMDIIKITSYVTYVTRNYVNGVIYPHDTTLPNLEIDDNKAQIICFNNGEYAERSSITPDSIVSIAADKELFDSETGRRMIDAENASLYRIDVSNKTVQGSVTSTGADIITINKMSYYMGDYCYIDMQSNSRVRVGDNVKIYLDADESIILVRHATTSDDSVVGFLINGIYDEELDKAYLTFVTETQETKKYELKPKVRIKFIDYKASTSSKKMDDDKVIDALKDSSGKIVQELLSYNVDSEGKISAITRPVKKPADGYDSINFSLDAEYTNGLFQGNKYYGSFEGNYWWNYQVPYVIFFASVDEGERYTAKDFTFPGLNFFYTNNDDLRYDVKIYESDEIGIGRYFVVNATASTELTVSAQKVMIFDKMIEMWDEEEWEVKDILKGYVDGEYVEVAVKHTASKATQPEQKPTSGLALGYDKYNEVNSISDLKRGDVIAYVTNVKGDIITWQPLFLEAKQYITPDRIKTHLQMSSHPKGYMNVLANVDLFKSDIIKFSYLPFYYVAGGATGAIEDSAAELWTGVAGTYGHGTKYVTRSYRVADDDYPVLYDTESNQLSRIDFADIITTSDTNGSRTGADKVFYTIIDGDMNGFLVIR